MKYGKTITWVLLMMITFVGTVNFMGNLSANKQLVSLATDFSTLTRDEQILETAFQARNLAIREQLAAVDLNKLDAWWRREQISDPHKYLLPVILSRLSLGKRYPAAESWKILLNMDKDKPDLYHFRAVFDIPIFFKFRKIMPQAVEASYRRMLTSPHIWEWMEQGTENHMAMQRLSGLALMNGSGWPNPLPGIAATNEAWLRAELNKYFTIGQGEFHSSTYYGYAIGGWLNLYDFAKTPQLRQLAKAALDWYATNMALRLSWGTAGGAESRGFDRGTWDKSELSAVAWMWWGDKPETAKRLSEKSGRVALLAGLSSYRPPSQLRVLARKEVPLPFTLQASHPGYYSYHQGNQFWENFYITPDYSLGTLLQPDRAYEVKGTINAQYATYKLVVRNPKGIDNAVISLAGTFHSPMATGSSPGDQYVQSQGAVIYQLRLNDEDKAAGIPGRSHLVLPARYGKPVQQGNWYIWRIENTWLCSRPWGDKINWQETVSAKNPDYQVLAAIGNQTAWVTDMASVADYPDLPSLVKALKKTQIDDSAWKSSGQLTYTSLQGDRLSMTYEANSGIGRAIINGKERILKNWAVLDSPYVKEELKSGVLSVKVPKQKSWRLRVAFTGVQWD
ncbi:hypothetical protein [Nostoc sp. TCL26-01]|uniref:hypothetical protein n=1 Tax=Nostoc sp. TCL26-01 TaxID=2576904 RepID=UPI0015BFBFE9|nr:hypothetical protein [Nostoc sp. TCL26-01]